MLALLRHPGELQRLRDDPSLIRSAIEELLRYHSPVQIAGRGARADAVIGGQCIAARGATLLPVRAGTPAPPPFPNPRALPVGAPPVGTLGRRRGVSPRPAAR